MASSHAAGWGPDAPNPDQFKELFAQVASGRVTRTRMQAFLEGETPPMALTDAERAALEILGADKVLGFRDVINAWNQEMPEAEPAMLFTEEMLKECAEGTADWRLAYIQGLPLRQQQETRGWNRKKPPCFDHDVKWWLDNREDSWATKPVESGYRLFDFTCRFANLHWQTQADEIAKLGGEFARAEEQAVAEFCFSNFLLNNGEYLLPNWYHWGLQTSGGSHVYVGGFDRRGFGVCNYWDDLPHDYLAVVLARKAA